jgi:hypothetical protein
MDISFNAVLAMPATPAVDRWLPPDNANGYRHGRGRLRGDDFGLTARPSLLGLARTDLEAQARLWPELAGTPAVPTVTDAVVEAIADDFER